MSEKQLMFGFSVMSFSKDLCLYSHSKALISGPVVPPFIFVVLFLVLIFSLHPLLNYGLVQYLQISSFWTGADLSAGSQHFLLKLIFLQYLLYCRLPPDLVSENCSLVYMPVHRLLILEGNYEVVSCVSLSLALHISVFQ